MKSKYQQKLTIPAVEYSAMMADARTAVDAKTRLRYVNNWSRMWRNPAWDYGTIMPWAEMPALVRSTSGLACLSHRPRFMTIRPGGISSEHWCGALAINVTSIEDDFVCHSCEERAVHFGWPPSTFIPDTGCSATEGRRFRPRKVACSGPGHFLEWHSCEQATSCGTILS